MIDAVLFDVDGTLVDHRAAALEAVSRLIERYPERSTRSGELCDLWWALERHHMAAYLAGDCSFAEQRRRRLRAFLPVLGEVIPGDSDLDDWFAINYLHAFESAWRSYTDAGACLAALSAGTDPVIAAVISNGDPEQQRAKLRRCGLLDAFTEVFTPTELGAAKPDPDCFLTACERLRVAPADAMYVGDWLQGDAVAASDAGLVGVWLDRGIDPLTGDSTSPADCEGLNVIRITDLMELLRLVTYYP